MSEALVRRKLGGVSFLEGGGGMPLLLLHGIPGSAVAWEGVGRILAGRYRVLIPDLAGFGASDSPPGDYYIDAQAEHVHRLLEALGVEELFLGAHDFGGPVALTLLRRFPRPEVRALVVSATNLFTDTYVPPPLRLAGVPVIGTLFFRLAAGNRFGLRLMYRAANRQGLRAPREHLTPSGMDLTRRIFQRSLADLPGNYGPLQAMLPDVRVPTLVLWGDRDPFFSTGVGRRTADAIPGGQLRVLSDTGHFVPEERPARVADEMDRFLSGLTQPAHA